MRAGVSRWFIFTITTTIFLGCGKTDPERTATPSTGSAARSENSVATAPKEQYPPATRREGSPVSRAPQDDVLFVADEDHQAIRVLPLPLAEDTKVTTISVPGHPAQIIASRDRVLVTLRDTPEGGGALLILKRDGTVGLNEIARIALPTDSWGLAISPDESLAVVSNAWAASVSIVDLEKRSVKATLPVGREPRGVTILPDGKRAYVSHLTSNALTRIADLDGATPAVTKFDFPAAPMRSPQVTTGPASLGYTAIPSPKGDRLFFARHALDTFGGDWFGSSVVDVWLPNKDKPFVDKPPKGLDKRMAIIDGVPGQTQLKTGSNAFGQPRAAIYRARSQSLLVVSEGHNELVELDALMSDPTLGVMRRYFLGTYDHKFFHVATRGGAPSGVTLSADEEIAYVYCRSTDEVAAVRLINGEGDYEIAPPFMVRLVDDGGKPADESYALGRALFYDATDEVTSGQLGCAGCHPDGRDDGHVWHETRLADSEMHIVNFLASDTTLGTMSQRIEGGGYGCGFTAFQPEDVEGDPESPTGIGHSRQTPMIAGRVDAAGPYGWHGESADLTKRIEAGFGLHRWRTAPDSTPEGKTARATHLAKFIRTGLVAPKKLARPLTEEEQKGKTIFESPTAQCARCHVPATGFTDRSSMPLSQPPLAKGFAKEENTAFKTPSLLNVVGTAPYFHDARFATLSELVEKNGDKMGKTSHLSAEDKKALVAYLETL
jgi:mono/diheme cytochrome c family protein